MRRVVVLAVLTLTCLGVGSAAGFSQESLCAKNARMIQALIGDDVVSVTRFDLGKIDFSALGKRLAELCASSGDPTQQALLGQMLPALLTQMAAQAQEAQVSDFYRLNLGDTGSIMAIPAEGLSLERKQNISAILAQQSPDSTVVERFGFLILYGKAFDSEKIKARFEKPSDKPRPTLLAGLAASEGAAISTVYLVPADIFTIPKLGKISPLAKEQEAQLSYAVLAVSLVGEPRAILLLKAADEASMTEIASAVDLLASGFKENDSILAKMLTEELKKQGQEAFTPVALNVITQIFSQIKSQTNKDQMALTLELAPIFKEIFPLLTAAPEATPSEGTPSEGAPAESTPAEAAPADTSAPAPEAEKDAQK